MATSLRTKRRIFDLNRIILSMLNKASNFDHKYDISFSPTQYLLIKILIIRITTVPRNVLNLLDNDQTLCTRTIGIVNMFNSTKTDLSSFRSQ